MGDTDPLKENCVIMTEDYYYNTDWKCVEERDSGETCPRKQYAYGIRGRNDLVARDNYRYNSSSGSPSYSSAGKERHYALSDAMGSVTAVASTAGTVVERYSYTAFGKGQVMTANFADRSMSLYDWQTRFHGESRDEETGYYNYGYRYYLPELGKWPSRDPIEEEGGVNLYAFVGNDAVNWIDVNGLARGKCDKEHVGDIEINSFTITTRTLLGNEAEMSDPNKTIAGFLGDEVKGEVKDALEKKSKILKRLNDATSKAKKFTKAVGLLSELFSSAGLIVDEIEMEVNFECCKCTKDGDYEWVKKSGSASERDIGIKLTSKDIKKLPQKYIDVMVGAAQDVVDSCP
jgi:RHS repeat-associated protein